MGDRAMRFISTRDVEVFHLVASGTLEEGAMTIQERQRARNQALLDGAPMPSPDIAAATTLDDYLFLLKFVPSRSS